jgi:hypothetical protein
MIPFSDNGKSTIVCRMVMKSLEESGRTVPFALHTQAALLPVKEPQVPSE